MQRDLRWRCRPTAGQRQARDSCSETDISERFMQRDRTALARCRFGIGRESADSGPTVLFQSQGPVRNLKASPAGDASPEGGPREGPGLASPRASARRPCLHDPDPGVLPRRQSRRAVPEPLTTLHGTGSGQGPRMFPCGSQPKPSERRRELESEGSGLG